ncbi:hypothetical protein [Pendulispora albinea]|uniref:Uncharacterized protein n=1 Tax=Pendulispora albinea TaxID=2741071 RepID=A0ABZ2LYE2_9BACT
MRHAASRSLRRLELGKLDPFVSATSGYAQLVRITAERFVQFFGIKRR